ncbi:nuclear transport factor 2 family protein [Streptomyces sp. NPDC048491]|uniref:nuclear transport factor 2 family protein n=1 Tax=Streptomyces TaxID=1883 RepID=UPI001D658696|nr:nuclear transport factor 2 family protein [Streptomyces sp. MAG02]
MTQRVDLGTLLDRLAIDELITGYAAAVDDGNWTAYRALFAADGRADYRPAGGIEGPAEEVARWLEETMRLFPVRQHLITNRLLTLQDLGGYPGDRAELRADYLNPMCFGTDGDGTPPAPGFESGGRYAFSLVRTDTGWRLRSVTVHEKWRRVSGALAGA